MSQILLVQDGDLAGKSFKSMRSLSKELTVGAAVVVLEKQGTKTSEEMTDRGYRLVTMTDEGIKFSRPVKTVAELDAKVEA